MKKTIIAFVFASIIIAIMATGASADMLWSLDKYPADLNRVGEGINKGNQTSNLIPVGIESQTDAIYILSADNSIIGASEWKLQSYKTVDDFKNAITAQMNEGFTPVDLSCEPDKIYVLYLKLKDLKPDAWQLVTAKMDNADIKDKMTQWTQNGYAPFGITIVDNQYGILCVHSNRKITQWNIGAYKDNVEQMKSEMKALMQGGDVPFGLIAGSKNFNIMFLTFAGNFDGVWTSASGQTYELSLANGTVGANYGGVKHIYSIINKETDGKDTKILANIKSVEINLPSDYPKVLADADKSAVKTQMQSLSGKSFVFKITPASDGAIILTIQSPGSAVWSVPERYTRSQ